MNVIITLIWYCCGIALYVEDWHNSGKLPKIDWLID